jgi:hypothetical protein
MGWHLLIWHVLAQFKAIGCKFVTTLSSAEKVAGQTSPCYRMDKNRENMAALAVLGHLLQELDSLGTRERLLALVQGVLAANIFDWGAEACVGLYHNGTILDIYQKARRDITQRPWRHDDFDAFAAAWFAREGEGLNASSESSSLLRTNHVPAWIFQFNLSRY